MTEQELAHLVMLRQAVDLFAGMMSPDDYRETVEDLDSKIDRGRKELGL